MRLLEFVEVLHVDLSIVDDLFLDGFVLFGLQINLIQNVLYFGVEFFDVLVEFFIELLILANLSPSHIDEVFQLLNVIEGTFIGSICIFSFHLGLRTLLIVEFSHWLYFPIAGKLFLFLGILLLQTSLFPFKC